MTNVTPGLLVLAISLLINLLQGVQSVQIPGEKVPQVVKNAIPKHVKALYKADKAIYAKDYAYKLIPIPNKPLSAPAAATTTVGPTSRSSRAGRQAWNTHYPKMPPSRSRRRKVRPPPVRMTYTMPAPYAAKYKSYAPVYKKRPRYSPPRMVAPGRYPPKYRMPIHSNVIEPMDDYQDEEVMPEVMDEEPIVMESMVPSYSGASMGQTMALMGPSPNDEVYMSDYDDMSPVRMPSRPAVEYVSDDDYVMRHPDYYSGGGSGGYISGVRGRGTQIRAVKPSSVMYSSRYRDMRNSESRFEPETIAMARRPMKQMPEFASSPQYSSDPEPKYRPYSSEHEPKYRSYSSEPEPKYRSYNSEPEPKYGSYSSELESKYRSNGEDSDFLSSNLRLKSELPDYMRSGKYESAEDAKDTSIALFSRQQPTAQPSSENSKWAGSLKFMPRPFASPVESSLSNGNSNASGRHAGKKNQDGSASSNHNNANSNYNKFNYEAPVSHTKQSALTIHDLLLQQAKQIQQSNQDSQSSPAQGRDLGDDYTNVNDFLVYNGPRAGDVYKSTAQRFRSSEGSGITRRSTGSEVSPQFHRYTRPAVPDLDDMDAVLDSLPWKVKRK